MRPKGNTSHAKMQAIRLPDRLRLLKEPRSIWDAPLFRHDIRDWPKDEYLSRGRAKGLQLVRSGYCPKGHKGRRSYITARSCLQRSYVKAGGRAAFYYAQDWDWYRLAALGKFAMVGQCLYQARITQALSVL
jgi:hypothetical protein